MTLSDLPHISETAIIDGGNGGVATNRVEITAGTAIATGLEVNSADGTEIRNLVINGFNRQIGLFPRDQHQDSGLPSVPEPRR